jgi:hypothetical protein
MLKGVSEMKTKLLMLSRGSREAAIEGVDIFGNTEMNEMQARVPVKTGELKSSGYVDRPVVRGTHITQEMGFTAEHAMVVHEDLEAFHYNGEAKFMESVHNESEPYFATRVGNYVKRKLGL